MRFFASKAGVNRQHAKVMFIFKMQQQEVSKMMCVNITKKLYTKYLNHKHCLLKLLSDGIFLKINCLNELFNVYILLLSNAKTMKIQYLLYINVQTIPEKIPTG